MTTSSSKNFELDVAEYIEEAFERCGLELRTAYDLKTAKRSLNLLLAEWANRGLNQWTISHLSLKKAPERTGMLKQLYEEEFQRALSQDEDRASFRATPDLRSYNYA
jgi:hypothetical protein